MKKSKICVPDTIDQVDDKLEQRRRSATRPPLPHLQTAVVFLFAGWCELTLKV